MNKPLLTHEAVTAIIPQQPPILMVDKLWFNDATTTISGFTIKDDNIFCKEGLLREPGIIENIAQTAALRAGYAFSLVAKTGKKTNPPIGYIAAIKKLIIYQLPKIDIDLKTEITIQQIIFDITLLTATVMANDNLIATCEMKIFLKTDEAPESNQ